MASLASGSRYKYSIVACARWEESDIVEWIEYHRAVGFEHFYIYSNDDTPTALMKTLIPYLLCESPLVTLRHWPFVGQQPEIYFNFMENHLQETEWFSFLDVDEFLVFKGSNSVAQFMKPFEEEFDAVYFNWVLYGHNGFNERGDGSVLLNYTRRAAHIDLHTKVITRSSAVDPQLVRAKFLAGAIGFWHFWNEYDFEISRLTNVIRGNMAGYTDDFFTAANPAISETYAASEAIIATAYVAHFQFKSERDFLRRAERGGFPMASVWGEMFRNNTYKDVLQRMNAVEDTYLAGFWAQHVGRAYQTAAYLSVPTPSFPNVAICKPSQQSSFYEGGLPTKDRLRGNANNGYRSGGCGFHTAFEPNPWWVVDLLGQHIIEEIHVYNRFGAPGVAEQACFLAIEISKDNAEWQEVFTTAGTPPGNIYTTPLVVRLEETPVSGRFVRLISRKPTLLHLDEVEVYGLPLI